MKLKDHPEIPRPPLYVIDEDDDICPRWDLGFDGVELPEALVKKILSGDFVCFFLRIIHCECIWL